MNDCPRCPGKPAASDAAMLAARKLHVEIVDICANTTCRQHSHPIAHAIDAQLAAVRKERDEAVALLKQWMDTRTGKARGLLAEHATRGLLARIDAKARP